MATNKVTASLTINFSADSAASATGALVLEVDDRPVEEGGLNGGKTSFRPGDSVVYLLYRASNVALIQHIATAGGIASLGTGNRAVDEVLTFSGSREASLRYPATSAVTRTWLGRTGGSDSMDGQSTVVLDQEGVGLLRCVYQAQYTAYRLSAVAAGIDQVLIYAQGSVS